LPFYFFIQNGQLGVCAELITLCHPLDAKHSQPVAGA
jgi:hypothetical protein